MHLRTSLVAAAAIVAAGLLGLSSTAFATTGTVSGQFKSGSASFAGSTYGCTGGTVAGTYDDTSNPALTFNTLNISCSTPLGTATVSLVSPCTVPVTLTTGRTSGLDTAIGGSIAAGSSCVKVSSLFGACTAYGSGTFTATFNETVKTGGWQDVIFDGAGTLVGASPGCSGLYSGSFTLVNFDFNVKPASGSINFV